jgi:DNA-binding response OmpR family regulator
MTEPSLAAKATILLAESDILVRAPLAQYLRDCGYRVVEAATAAEAKQGLGRVELDISSVISSVKLAGDGFGISQWAKHHRPDVNVLIAGSPGRAVEIAAGFCRGGGPALDPGLLLQRIQRMLATRNRSPRVA